jgi:D-glycero-alpha-D-manno-heptose 1-phosphate guanylyltransferase
MQIREAVILAGGLGTRLRSAVPDLPKCMAPVNDKPFIAYVIDYFLHHGLNSFVFSLGYMHEVIVEFITQQYPALHVQYAIEAEPLGTGGAIRLACKKANSKTVLVANGDTLFKISVNDLLAFHDAHDAQCTLALKPMKNFERYGVVELNDDDSIRTFKEKQFFSQGFINGGIYALNAPDFLDENLPEKFSFEKEYLEKLFTQRKMFGFVQDAYFIDIGIPEDYSRAKWELTGT